MSGRYDYFLNGYQTALQMRTTGPSPTTARISTTATASAPDVPFTIASRRVAGHQGANVPGTRAELWGATGTATPTLRAVGTGDAAGLVQFPVHQSSATRYEVRWSRSGTWAAATTPPVSIASARAPTAVRISVDRTAVRRGAPVVVGMRVVNAATGLGLAGVPVQLWQTVNGTPWVLRVNATTDRAGLVKITRSPTDPVTYQARFPGTSTWATSASSTVKVSILR
jgi:hypothetical protein